MVDDIPSFFFPFPSGHERGAMNVSVMDLRDSQDNVLPSSLAPTGASWETAAKHPISPLGRRGICALVSGVPVSSVLGSRG